MYSIAVTVCAYIKYVQTLTTILDSVGIPTISKITVRTDVVVRTALTILTILNVQYGSNSLCVH